MSRPLGCPPRPRDRPRVPRSGPRAYPPATGPPAPGFPEIRPTDSRRVWIRPIGRAMGVVARIRKRTYEVMEVARPDDHLSRIVDTLLMALVVGNVFAVILESVESLGHAYKDLFIGFEEVSVAAFTAELVCRIWAAREAPGDASPAWRKRLRYVLSPMAIIDILAIAPFYLTAHLTFDLRFLRILRLLRTIKLTRYSNAMGRLGEVFRMQRSAFAAAFFLLGIAIILSASALHLVEHRAQPEAFGSIPAAMWWAVCTLTTVGYGDVAPITPLGKAITSFITILGIGLVALPTSLITSGFARVMARNEKA
ncbi:MAG TPA: ion transporter, partial [Deltaproteobacteria bacterium]|nr:ion transporter [Deltaproteobacteria bacterium]